MILSLNNEQKAIPPFKLKSSTPTLLKQKIKSVQVQLGSYFYQQFHAFVNMPIAMTCQQKQKFYCQILQFIESWQIQLFIFYILWEINSKQQQKIIKTHSPSQSIHLISPIKFQELQRIYLSNCDIVNIEPLSWIYCPKLTDLSLNENSIDNLKSTSKLNLTSLSQINIVNNIFSHHQLGFLIRMNANNSVFFRKLWLNRSKLKWSYQNKVFLEMTVPEDLAKLVKFPLGSINKVAFKCSSIFATQKFQSKLKQKLFSEFK